ncbi:MAG: hypothetical protein IPJ75_18410 [Ignavibacteriales bacterium]|nr:hypothetical protein [Ignavibacteriales bacterium]
MKKEEKFKIAEIKVERPVKKGLREFDDLRDAIRSMEEHNSGFYFRPGLNYGVNPDPATLNKISKIECNCDEFLKHREEFLKTLEIRFLCKHVATKLAELTLHPVILLLLLNKAKHGRERYVLLSAEEPIILGFVSLAKLKWINVYHFDNKRDVAIRFSYNPFENKWSYGKLPPDGTNIEHKIITLLRRTFLQIEKR